MSHDPFAPPAAVDPGELETRADLDAAYSAFPEDRWRRVGATDADIAGLRAVWESFDATQQADEGQYMASQPDTILAVALDAWRAQNAEASGASTPAPPDPSTSGGVDLSKGVKAVLADVGSDPVKAAAALAAESARGDDTRSSLVEALERIVARAPAPSEPASGGADEAAGDPAGDGAGDDATDAADAGDGGHGEQQRPPATQ